MNITVGNLKKGQRRYYVNDDTGNVLVWFDDDLATAGLVLRYLMGARMSKADETAARDALRVAR